jgi:hypothetical protein
MSVQNGGRMVRRINSRAKGAAGEREFCSELSLHLGDHLTEQLKRNLEQTRNGGHDIQGLPGWAVEVKRYKSLTETEIANIWEKQAVDQAMRISAIPALAYREDRRPWRVRVPINVMTGEHWSDQDRWHIDWTIEVGLAAFAYIVREQSARVHLRGGLHTCTVPGTLTA